MLKKNILQKKGCSNERKTAAVGAAAVLITAMLSGSAFAEETDSGLTAESYQTALNEIVSSTRWAGTPEAQEAADRITEKLESYGLKTEQQSFVFTSETKGKQTTNEAVNVVAVKPAEENGTGDILILSAHYDTMACTTGANDNASGEALLLELARVLQDTASDTEIRFLSFSAEEEGLIGSAAYVETLTPEEKERIIGDIQIDMIGHYRSSTCRVTTAADQEELLGKMLVEASEEVFGEKWETARVAASDHASFSFAGIPAVAVEQEPTGDAENHRYIDSAEIIDAETAVKTGKVIEAVVRRIASEETGSLLEEAKSMTAAETAVPIEENTSILFGVDRSNVSIKLGASGTFEKDTDSEFGYVQSHYIMNAKWFDWEPLVTDFIYRKDTLTLDRVLIRTEELGLSEEELGERLTEALGEPEIQEGADPLWGSSSMAENPSLRQYMITEEEGEQVIEVLSYMHFNVGEDIRTYKLQEADNEKLEGDAADKAVLRAVQKVIPQEDPYVKNVISWTDGYSYVLGSCTADETAKSDSFSIRIDKNDFFDQEGNLISESKFLATAIHEYGHALTLNESQMNTSLLTDMSNYNDISIYQDSSYMKAFYDAFYSEEKQRDFYEHPEDFVNEYAGTSGVFEDIAESFMQFVISGRREEDTFAAQKINFFYEYPELVEIRDYIRQNFGYEQ